MLIVGVGGTLRQGSSTELILRLVLEHAAGDGAETILFAGSDLDMPLYNPAVTARSPNAKRMIDALRQADAVVIGSPGYHGGVSGLVKNALDYTEDMAGDARPYLDGRPIGCIGTGAGHQGAGAALTGLRTIVHALRGWPTPLGIACNTQQPCFSPAGKCIDSNLASTCVTLARQLAAFRSVTANSLAAA